MIAVRTLNLTETDGDRELEAEENISALTACKNGTEKTA
jgi:hypothetical protein